MCCRRGHGVTRPAAQPYWHFEKSSTGMIGLVGFAQAIFVDAAKEESAQADRTALRQHRAEDTAPFRSARKTGERHRPLRGLRPIFANRFQSGAEQTKTPLGGVDARSDRRIRSENYPPLGSGRRAIPF